MKARLALAAIVLAVLGLGAWACLGPEERIAYLFHDDAFYYLGVAKHMAAGDGSTFDGINRSNGYHPLWCWLLVPLFWFVDDPGRATRIVGMAWFTLAALSAVLLWWALAPRSGRLGAAVAAGVFALHPAIMLKLGRPNGLETPLYAALLALYIGLWERTLAHGKPTRKRLVAIGVLLGAMILSRLDAGMFAIASAILLLLRTKSLAPVVTLAAASSAVVLPVLGWNAISFGSPMPISERAVQVYAAPAREALGDAFWPDRLRVAIEELPTALTREAFGGWTALDPVWEIGWPVGAAILVIAIVAVLAAIRVRTPAVFKASDAYVLLALGCAIHFAAYAAWFWVGGEREFRLYYFMPEGMLVAATLGALSVRVSPRLVILGIIAYVIAGAAVSKHRIEQAPSEPGPLAERRLFGWVKKNLPQDAVLATTDAGILGFFSGRPVVNLDGLINDERFLEALRKGRRDVYVVESPITHLVAGEGALHGWSPEEPDRPPDQHDWMGTLLYEVNRLPGVRLREAGRVEGWVVYEILK